MTRKNLIPGTFPATHPKDVEKALGHAIFNTDVEKKAEAILGFPVKVSISYDAEGSKWNCWMRKDKEGEPHFEIAWGVIKPFPGCCGMAVSTAAGVVHIHRNKGIGAMMNLFRQEVAWQLGYTVLIATDVASNVVENKILKANGWKSIDGFKNRRTGNEVVAWAVNLRGGREE